MCCKTRTKLGLKAGKLHCIRGKLGAFVSVPNKLQILTDNLMDRFALSTDRTIYAKIRLVAHMVCGLRSTCSTATTLWRISVN